MYQVRMKTDKWKTVAEFSQHEKAYNFLQNYMKYDSAVEFDIRNTKTKVREIFRKDKK